MREFLKANKDSYVIYGEWIHGELFYKLDSGDCFWLSKEDLYSVENFKPDWGFNK